MSAMSDAALKQERAELAAKDKQLAERMRQLQMDMREELIRTGDDADARGKWNEARKQRQAGTARMSEIEAEQMRREKAKPEYQKAVRDEEARRRQERHAADRFNRLSNTTYEQFDRRETEAVTGWMSGKRARRGR
ncbi:hypothetical protein [Adlercreutzia shanghongiae]|uniref:Uncharacterized protein n=2 Tax=Adlercreutzia shanghongiae TaxID=3111773 RepID=A0ABU6IWY7_9ACTN|nr:hypothetical protein [Adlercreutzia sp. R22]MEC4294366.1 hypothetical protein [Adlercreutzia sp. R22]